MSIYKDRADGFEAGQVAKSRPDVVTDEHLEFLDQLRKSGRTNMFCTIPFLMEEFPELEDGDASLVLSYWMKSFGKDDR